MSPHDPRDDRDPVILPSVHSRLMLALEREAASERRRAAVRRVLYAALLAGLFALLALALGGCGCSQINRPASAIAKDLPLLLDQVAPASTLTLGQAVKVEELAEKLRRNAALLEEASR